MRIVLDTGVIIAFVAGEKDKSIDSIEKILDMAKSKKIDTVISSVTVSEIYAYFCRKKDPRKAVEVCAMLEEIGTQVASMEKEIAKNSGFLKSKYPISFADAIILATCISIGGCLITYDPEFLSVKEVQILKPEEFIKIL